MQWRDARTVPQKRALLEQALAEHRSVRAAARALGVSHTTIQKAIAQHGNQVATVATGNQVGGGNPFFSDPLTESRSVPILGGMDARAAVATEPQEPVAFSKPLNMSVGWDDLMTFVRVQTELRAILRREPAQGEMLSAMLAYLARHAGPEDGPATAPVMAAALAPFLREVRS